MESFSIDSLTTIALTYGVKAIGAILIFVIGRQIASIITKIFFAFISKYTKDETIASFFQSAIYMVLLIAVVFAALSNLGVHTTSFIAILGTIGLTVGLALKGTFSNIGAGLMIVFFKPFKVKDIINVSGVSGTVESINVFSTILKTGDNRKIIIPNSKIISGNIVNESAKRARRVDIIVGISYEDDLKNAKSVLLNIVENNPNILNTPPPTVAVFELGDSSVNFTLRAWVKTSDYTSTKFALNEAIKLRFDEEGITIPYPQLEITKKQ